MYTFFNINEALINFFWGSKITLTHPMFRYTTITKPVMVKISYSGYMGKPENGHDHIKESTELYIQKFRFLQST